MSGTTKIMNQIVKHLSEEKGESLNTGRIFTCFDDGDRNILPNEILVKIFQYLPFTDLRQCALVSKAWRVLSLCPVLWRKFQLKKVTLDVPYLERLVNCGVQQLHMESSKICVNSQPLATPYFESSTFTTVQYLSIEWTDIENDLLEVIVLMVPNLKCFIFKDPYGGTIFNTNILSALLHLEFLEKLHLFDITLCFSECLDILDKTGIVATLQSLALCCTLEDDTALENAMNFVEKYLSLFPNLQYVELCTCPWFYVNDNIFKRLAQLKNLKCLKMRITRVSSEVMKTLNQWKSFVQLKELHIICVEMDEKSIILLLQASSNVEVLEFYADNWTTAILETLLCLNNLKLLDLWISDVECPPVIFLHDDKLKKNDSKLSSLFLGINDSKFVNLRKMLSLFKYLENLTMREFLFNEEVLIEILKMKNLTKLDIEFEAEDMELSSLRKIQGELQELKEFRTKFFDSLDFSYPLKWILSRTPNLKLLEVCDYHLDIALLFGFSSLKRLEELRFKNCVDWMKETHSNFELYAQHYMQLNKLVSVYFCYKKYERKPYGLRILLSMCRNVKKLHIHRSRVTRKLFDTIKTMKELECLEMKEVTMFRDFCAAEILEYFPNLTEHRVIIETLKK